MSKISGITLFNHPPNTVVLKVTITIVTKTFVVRKPTELTPRNAIKLAEIRHQASLSVEIFKIFNGWPNNIGDDMVTKHDIKTEIFSGRLAMGRMIAQRTGSIRAVL